MIPSEAIAGFDMRISPHHDLKEIKEMVSKWCEEEGVSWKNVMFKIPEEH